MLLLEQIDWRHDPYKIGLAKPALAEGAYEQLAATFPPEAIMGDMGQGYCKKSLSEINRPVEYIRFIKACVPWWRFYKYIKSAQFMQDVLPIIGAGTYRARFEFSSMPADGGRIDPHTDIVSKVLTLIVPMVSAGTLWGKNWGGGTDVLKPHDPNEPLMDYKAPFSSFARVHTYEYLPNQCVVFLKSANSWHSVGPIVGPAGQWRRSITINVERTK